MITKEARFDAVIKDDKVVLLLSAREMPPQNDSKIGFNGKDCCLLSRDEHEDILLTNFPKEVIFKLQKTQEINVWEISSEGKVIFKYSSDLFKDPDLKSEIF